MFTLQTQTPRHPCSAAYPLTLVLWLLLSAPLWAAAGNHGEPLYPTALMNWMVEGSFHALIVDKSQQRLMVWKIKDGEPTLVESFRCATGENEGDKWVRGDMRTPEGVYFFCSVIDGRTLPTKYGFWAFTTDYPNFVDRRRGKSGDGIWLHGRDKPLGAKPDSNGCIALENQDLVKASRYIRLQSTPLIVVEKLHLASRSAIIQQERELRDFIEGWRQTWESQDLEAYMERYSPNFQSCWLDYRAWKEKKRKLLDRYRKIRVKLGSVYLYRQNGMVTSIFTQEYASESYRSGGIKVLYLIRDSRYRIYAEDYHRPVDDTFPVASLLARSGVDPGSADTESRELNIRLVSTDEPDHTPAGEIETPRPTAPSRAVVMEKFSLPRDMEIRGPAVLAMERPAPDRAPERLVVSRVVYADVMAQSDLQPRSPLQCTVGGVQSAAVAAKTERAEDNRAQPRWQNAAGATRSATPGVIPAGEKNEEKFAGDSSRSAALSENAMRDRDVVVKFLSEWKRAWERKDLDSYTKMYHPGFQSGTTDYPALLKSKEKFFRKYGTIRVRAEQVQIERVGERLVVKFLQHFRGDDYRDKGWKTMVLAGGKEEGYRIVSEDWSALPSDSRDARAKGSQQGSVHASHN